MTKQFCGISMRPSGPNRSIWNKPFYGISFVGRIVEEQSRAPETGETVSKTVDFIPTASCNRSGGWARLPGWYLLAEVVQASAKRSEIFRCHSREYVLSLYAQNQLVPASDGG